MHRTIQLHVLLHIILFRLCEDLRDELYGCGLIDEGNKVRMDKDISLRLYINQAVVSTVQVLAIIDIFPDHTERETIEFAFFRIELA